ncbi:MAG: VanZ family protein [Gemmatimonadaceae bacterium]
MIERRWVPPFVWAAVILTATSVPSPRISPSLGGGDKIIHFGMYGVLGALTMRAAWRRRSPALAFALVVSGVAAFGAVDEWHQRFIPGRGAELLDWVADASGGTLGALAGSALARRGSRGKEGRGSRA